MWDFSTNTRGAAGGQGRGGGVTPHIGHMGGVRLHIAIYILLLLFPPTRWEYRNHMNTSKDLTMDMLSWRACEPPKVVLSRKFLAPNAYKEEERVCKINYLTFCFKNWEDSTAN